MSAANDIAIEGAIGEFIDEPGFLKRHVSFFRIALLFAIVGQPLAALAMHLLSTTGVVDFVHINPGADAAFHILAATFTLQIILILIALARRGVSFKRLAASVAVLLFALASLMLLFVALQCGLYGACL